MEAALYTYRCFAKPEDEFPYFVGAFILYGQSEMLPVAAAKRFDKLIAGLAKLPTRIHKTGPLTIHPSIRTQTEWQEIDWSELSRRVEREIPVRPENKGACIFLTSSTENRESVPDFEMPAVDPHPEITEEVIEEFQRALSQTPQSTDGCSFIFLGSAYQDNCHERTGVVYLIEAPSLTYASVVCGGLVKNSRNTTVLVGWCCSIYDLGSDSSED